MTGNVTRHSQVDFEQSLKLALINKDGINESTETLIDSIIENLKEKFDYYNDKMNNLETQLAKLNSYTERNETKIPNDNS